ncbi:MAG: DUF4160 domain-containing protein [Hyphomicrobiaceae bacterium]|nr:DUF4160 domain-containing protein [Hyphomicrobiaceae bacterium]
MGRPSRAGALACVLSFERAREPAHVCVRAGSSNQYFWLHDLSAALNIRFPRTRAERYHSPLEGHLDELLEAWNDHFGD